MTELPLIELQGPPIPRPRDLDPKEVWKFPPFWELIATSQEFFQRDKKDKDALQEDRIHPLRTLLLDPTTVSLDGRDWRLPRLMSLHVMMGEPKGFNGLQTDKEQLRVRLKGNDNPAPVAAIREFGNKRIAVIRTLDPATGERAGFQHIVAEPILDGLEEWPDLRAKTISVPPFRLVSGAIELVCNARDFEFLGTFIDKSPHKLFENDKTVLIRLTPAGIEVDASLPFPGQGSLPGRFLFEPFTNGPRIHLLPERRREETRWQTAWKSVTAADDKASRTIAGVKAEGRRGELVPAFVWQSIVGGVFSLKIEGVKSAIEVPASDVEARLLSPAGAKGIDGEVTLKPDSYTLAPFPFADMPDSLKDATADWKPADISFVLLAQLGTAPGATSRFVIEADRNGLNAKLESTKKNKPLEHRCAHNEVALAAALRTAYGFEELRAGEPDEERPLLSAFVPLDDGWLQLAVPNFPPPDVTKDDIVVPEAPATNNVLSGYLRFAQAGELPPVLSAFGKPLTVGEAPWTVTIDGTEALTFVVGIKTKDGNGGLIRAAGALENPTLSTRGLAWISADRPDALEALPRLGAGAGAYFDIPLDTYDIEKKPVVQFALAVLSMRVDHKPDVPVDVVKRTELAFGVSFDSTSPTGWQKIESRGHVALFDAHASLTEAKLDPKKPVPPLPPVRWQRHPRMPLAAAMPMTRSAAAAVRPLESRDLLPFLVDVPDGKPTQLLQLRWVGKDVFPAVRKFDGKDLEIKPLPKWPWPKIDSVPERGVALAAFGVPGAELTFDRDSKKAVRPWDDLQFALRHDFPVLDEAFATSTLPPQPPDQALPEEREFPPPPPVPLTHDWVTMRRFWEEQERRHQLARVANSYLGAFHDLGVEKRKIENFVGGLTWETQLGFKEPDTQDPPYGTSVVDVETEGNDALLGVKKNFEVSGEFLKPKNDGPVHIVGNSPSSFEEGGFLMDSRRTGWKTIAEKKIDEKIVFLFRPLTVKKEKKPANVFGLASLFAPREITRIDPEDGQRKTLFRFWFKDLPVTKAGVFVPPPAGVDFSAWQDGNLPRSGFEWRLVPADDTVAETTFKIGRDRIPFFGFTLEPLRLLACQLGMSGDVPAQVASATIEARLHIGPSRRGETQDGNLVALELERDGINLIVKKLTNLRATGLHFVPQTSPRVAVTATVEWKGEQPLFTVTKFTAELYGDERSFTGATLQGGAVVVMDWNQPVTNSIPLGSGVLLVERITVTCTPESATILVDERILLAPRARVSESIAAMDAPIRVGVRDGQATKLYLLGLELSANLLNYDHDLHDAFTLTVAPVGAADTGLSPFLVQIKATLSVGFAARLGTMINGRADLTAGYFDGELLLLGNRITAAARGTAAAWIGELRFFGRLELDNAILWPGIKDGTEIEPIPLPGKDKDGRTTIELIANRFYRDSAVYLLDGHAMPFDVAAGLIAQDDDAVWAVPVVCTHTITRDDDKAIGSFTGLETIAIGPARAIVPTATDADIAKDPLTFAGRYRNTIKDNGDVSNTAAPGMVHAGAGIMATVLRGALGLPFRRAFHKTARKGLFLAGGFVGVLAEVDGQPAPLLRLPFLATLTGENPGGIAQNGEPKVEVAWADGRAVRSLIATLRGAVTPASTTDAAIRTAILAGSRPLAASGLTPDEIVAAVLVEQSFAVGSDTLSEGVLATSPFFIAAAVTLARNINDDHLAGKTVLSLLAGSARTGEKSRSLAAALLTRNLTIEDTASTAKGAEERPELVTLGDAMVVHDWTGPAVSDLNGIVPVALIAGPAFADHVRPRAVLLRTVDETGQWRYDAPPLPQPFRRARLAAPVRDADRACADEGRGYTLQPDTKPMRWLAGPEEAQMEPFRDAKPGDETLSGLAGQSRVMGLAVHGADVDSRAFEDGMIWFAQTRAPVYLPLLLGTVHAPPIPWATPGTPRPRIPANHVVVAALRKLSLEKVQPIVPDRATLASVGDRAGISLARIGRLETPVGKIPAFDGVHARFGRPAQGGMWSVRTERTPRPGMLPKNTGDPERDRRPCASAILPIAPLTALVGPADTVSGEADPDMAKLGAWSVRIVAALDWNGMVTESWDGTVRLHAEVDVARKKSGTSPDDAVEMLFRLLFPPVANSFDALRASAALVIGDTVIPFLRMWTDPKKTAMKPIDDLPDNVATTDDVVDRGVVKLVLDPRPTDSSPQGGAALASIAEAFATGVLPPAEIRFVVHPQTRVKPSAFAQPSMSTLTVADASKLPEGDARAPVTLRFPLAPVITARGALPLVPTSILFIDPAYNASLASAPAEKRERIEPQGASLPNTRGALSAVFYADRNRVNRKASVTFMFDLAFEKKLDPRLRATVPNLDGDIVLPVAGELDLTIKVIAKATGVERTVHFGAPGKQLKIKLLTVYELPLASLVEPDGSPSVLEAGDMLTLTAFEKETKSVKVKVAVIEEAAGKIGVRPIDQLHTKAVSLTLRILLTDEPVIEPPPALYAALVRRLPSLSLPLYAQSPLPSRVDLRDAKNDFRAGLIRRAASFIWSLARPDDDVLKTTIHVAKVDRNGQTFLPKEVKSFILPRCLK